MVADRRWRALPAEARRVRERLALGARRLLARLEVANPTPDYVRSTHTHIARSVASHNCPGPRYP